ncbi:MAG: DNA polymerase IV [Planctomycetes bacterium]|nr:DNA polymerase IV [Planctomycetota bacterium]
MAVILLADIDAFFAQAEQVKRPELRGRPVIVGGHVTDRSVVASSSYEARARGVKTAMPVAQAVRICPDGIFLRGDFATYAEMSRQFHEVCLRHTPLVEKVSLDEAYLDLSGCERRYRRLLVGGPCPVAASAWPLLAARQLQRDFLQTTGLYVSIGVASSRMVAKVASDVAKPRGVVYVWPGREAAFLAGLPVGHLPGIGPKTVERLRRYSLQTVGQLAAIPRELLVEFFGTGGEFLYEAARGRGSAAIDPEEGLPKSISRETTFERDTSDRRKLAAMLSYLLQRACRQLRENGLLAGTVTLKLRYADFQTVARSRTLFDATDHDDELYHVLMGLLPRTYTRRVAVRLVGVALSGLTADGRQMRLFDEDAYCRRDRLYASMDAIRRRFGFTSLVTSRAVDLMETHNRKRDTFDLPVACLSR